MASIDNCLRGTIEAEPGKNIINVGTTINILGNGLTGAFLGSTQA